MTSLVAGDDNGILRQPWQHKIGIVTEAPLTSIFNSSPLYAFFRTLFESFILRASAGRNTALSQVSLVIGSGSLVANPGYYNARLTA